MTPAGAPMVGVKGYTRSMAEIGRLLVCLGIALVVIGGIVMLLGRTPLPLGKLPGDIVYRGKNTTLYFPLATSIVLSVLLSVIFFLVGWIKR
jgi:uncharacterized iron-regulated membrane protein